MNTVANATLPEIPTFLVGLWVFDRYKNRCLDTCYITCKAYICITKHHTINNINSCNVIYAQTQSALERAVGGHGKHTERVDLRLDDNVGKANDAVLDAGRKAVAHNFAKHIAVDADAARRNGVDLALAQQMAQAQQKADRLGDDRRHGTGIAPDQ